MEQEARGCVYPYSSWTRSKLLLVVGKPRSFKQNKSQISIAVVAGRIPSSSSLGYHISLKEPLLHSLEKILLAFLPPDRWGYPAVRGGFGIAGGNLPGACVSRPFWREIVAGAPPSVADGLS